jgi:hypothetical protein
MSEKSSPEPTLKQLERMRQRRDWREVQADKTVNERNRLDRERWDRERFGFDV